MFLEDPRDRKHRFKFARGQAVYCLRANKITECVVIWQRLGAKNQAGYWLGIPGTKKEFSKKESEIFETIRECSESLASNALIELGVTK